MANQTKKTGNASGGLYIALAICILSVICIGVYSAILNIFDSPRLDMPIVEQSKNKTEKKDDSTVKTPSVTTPRPSATIPNVTQAPQDVPEVNPQPEQPEQPEQNANAVPDPISYTMPVAGDVDVAFSGETLVYSETMNDYRRHCGVDLTSTIGTPVKAFTAGVVSEIYEDPLMGQTVVLDHGDGTKSYYRNLSPQLPSGIEVGVLVSEGDVIGGVGETVLIECAQTPHLHFEVTVNDEYVDPMKYFE